MNVLLSRTPKVILGADHFCGAGGASEGLNRACRRLGARKKVVAVNHWPVAVATHKRNHPDARHYCQDLRSVSPREAVPEGYLKILLAGPECVYYSRARGGAPVLNQQRATADDILVWLTDLYVETVLIENVPEFMEWGPVYGDGGFPPPTEKHKGRRVPELKGAYFARFVRRLRALGYRCEWRVLCCADYGDPTTRRRFFLQARRDGKPIVWPKPTHAAPADLHHFPERKPYVPMRNCIDWSDPGTSIFARKKRLCDNTMARILAGLEKHGGLPFVTASGGPIGASRPRGVDEPLRTVLTESHLALATPYLVVLRNGCDAASMDGPIPTLCTRGQMCLAQPVVAPLKPYLVKYHGGKGGENRTHSIDEPARTLDTSNRIGLCQPFLISYYSNGKPLSVDVPLPTVSTHDRFALIEVSLRRLRDSGLMDKGDVLCCVDILYRMLRPRELARAHSFADDYEFEGGQDEQVAQVGNSWPVETATALCLSLLTDGAEEA